MSNPVIDKEGNQCWYNADDLHREDGPAVAWSDGAEYWFINGQYHREDGPAYISSSGAKSWYINGKLCTDNKSFQKAANLTDEDMLMINLKYGNVTLF